VIATRHPTGFRRGLLGGGVQESGDRRAKYRKIFMALADRFDL
jgi:hypothetical protein